MTKVTIETEVLANINKVWTFWTTPKHITQWNFADTSWHCPKAENELKIGGSFKYRMEAKDGSFGFDLEGIYDEIIHEQKISYALADKRNVTTTFQNLDDKTIITTTFDAEYQNPIEMQKNGWQAILNNFKNYTETN